MTRTIEQHPDPLLRATRVGLASGREALTIWRDGGLYIEGTDGVFRCGAGEVILPAEPPCPCGEPASPRGLCPGCEARGMDASDYAPRWVREEVGR